MSVSGILSSVFSNLNSINVQRNNQQFKTEFQQLGQDLQSGNLTAAQSDFATLQQDAPQLIGAPPSASTNQLAQAFNQLSQDLTSGNLSAAQTDFSTIQQDFQNASGGSRIHHSHHRQGGSSIQQTLEQLGQELQAGNLSAAQQAYTSLQQDMEQFGQISSLTQSGAAPSTNTVSVQV